MTTSRGEGALEISSKRILFDRLPNATYAETIVTLRNKQNIPLIYKIKGQKSTKDWYTITPTSGEIPPGSSIDVKFRAYFLVGENALVQKQDRFLVVAWHPRSQSDPGASTSTHLAVNPDSGQNTYQRKISAEFRDLRPEVDVRPTIDESPTSARDERPHHHRRQASDVSIKLIPPSRSGTQDGQPIPVQQVLHDPQAFDPLGGGLHRVNSNASTASDDSVISSTSSFVSFIDQTFDTIHHEPWDLPQRGSPSVLPREITPETTRSLPPDRASYSSRPPDIQRASRPDRASPGLLGAPSADAPRSRSSSPSRDVWVEFLLCGQKAYAAFRKLDDTPYATGGYSDVWMAEVRYPDGRTETVAAKQLRHVGLGERAPVEALERMLARLTRETFVWMGVEHPNIVPLIGFTIRPPLVLVSPWYEGGNIAVYLRRNPGADKLKLLHDIARGLVYLHSRNPVVVHGDIKSDNVLINDGSALLIDFGLSMVIEDVSWYTTSHRQGGNMRWTAPELLLDENRDRSPATDVYSFGCLAFEIIVGLVPFHWASDMAVTTAIIVRRQKPAQDRATYPQLAGSIGNVIYACWADETHRPDMPQIERWISEIRKSI